VDEPLIPITALLGGAAAAALVLSRVKRRLDLSMAKHPSLTGHSRMAKRVARLLPGYAYDEDGFFNADGAPDDVVAVRRAALEQLSARYATRFARSIALTAEAAESISDLQFTRAYRVPYQFAPYLNTRLKTGSFLVAADGAGVTDLDGNVLYDLTGSYGVNVFGVDFYKSCMREGAQRVQELGLVLGAYHPVVADNVKRLTAISGMDEVSFHMSGTEAVMQAVRLARYHTRRKNVVRFCGAYHGWWDGVQPGPGNPMPPRDVFTLKEMDADSLHVLATRRDIACVLVNPLQALHPNKSAPGDSALVDGSRSAGFDRTAYVAWLKALRDVCTARGIALVFDEVFMGFRLARGGAQEYFGVQADIVTYGKTLGGGFPVGVVCGKRHWMRRFNAERPADICFARGTFNSHPVVMGAMNVFLERVDSPEIAALYEGADAIWTARMASLNQHLKVEGHPVTLASLQSVWTVIYNVPSRYNWMLQYYLRDQGLALSWVGTGRLIFPLSFTDAEFETVSQRFLAACRAMRDGGWWWHAPHITNKQVRRGLLREMISKKWRAAT
jgi:glutamate-1-semialdehyde 2,1-aminomutase